MKKKIVACLLCMAMAVSTVPMPMVQAAEDNAGIVLYEEGTDTGNGEVTAAADGEIDKSVLGEQTVRYLTGDTGVTKDSITQSSDRIQDFFQGTKSLKWKVDFQTSGSGLQSLLGIAATGNSKKYYCLYIKDGKIGFGISGKDITTSKTYNDGKYHTVEVEISKTGELNIKVDNEEAATDVANEERLLSKWGKDIDWQSNITFTIAGLTGYDTTSDANWSKADDLELKNIVLTKYVDKIIKQVAVSATAPKKDGTPAQATVAEDAEYIVEQSTWKKQNTENISGKFETENSYTLTVQLKAKTDYKFDEAYKPTTLAGAQLGKNDVSILDDGKTMVIQHTFELPAESIAKPTPSVTVPKVNESVKKVDNPDPEKYDIQTRWEDSQKQEVTKFEANKRYTVIITLKAKTGYKFTEESKPSEIETSEGKKKVTATITTTDGKTMEITCSFGEDKSEIQIAKEKLSELLNGNEYKQAYNGGTNPGTYTQTSWENFKTKFVTAESELNNTSTTVDKLTTAKTELEETYKSLQVKVDVPVVELNELQVGEEFANAVLTSANNNLNISTTWKHGTTEIGKSDKVQAHTNYVATISLKITDNKKGFDSNTVSLRVGNTLTEIKGSLSNDSKTLTLTYLCDQDENNYTNAVNELQSAIVSADSIKNTDNKYTQKTWEAFQNALNAAKDIQNKINNKETTTEQITAAKNKLITQQKALHSHTYGQPAWTWDGDGKEGYTATAHFTCNNCKETTDIKATDITSETTDSTCTEKGKVVYTAKVILGVTEYTDDHTDEIPAKGHDWSIWKVITKPSETAKGEIKRTCQNDPENHTDTAELPVLDKTNYEYKVETKAGCETEGVDVYTYKKDEQEIKIEVKTKALGHKLTKTAAKAATCTAAGNREYYTCSVCGKYFSDAAGKHEIAKDSWVIKAKGHTITKKETPATADREGKIEYSCDVCKNHVEKTFVLPRTEISVYMGKTANLISDASKCSITLANAKKYKKYFTLDTKTGKIKTSTKKLSKVKIKKTIPVKVTVDGKAYNVNVKLKIAAPKIKSIKKKSAGSDYRYTFKYNVPNATKVQFRIIGRENKRTNSVLDRYLNKRKSSRDSYIYLSKKDVENLLKKQKPYKNVRFRVRAYYGKNVSETTVVLSK